MFGEHHPGNMLMIQGNRKSHSEIADRLADTAGVRKALKQAASETIRDHARTGHKIVVWRDNQVVWEDVSLASIPTERKKNDEP
jgi:hypothetical protein